MRKIITDRKKLKKKCKPVEDVKEGLRIGKLLLETLAKHKNGVGLAANQIGIKQRVCVVNVLEPIIFVNPRVVSKFKKINFEEGCLSFPGDYVITERYANIAIHDDNNGHTIFDQNRSMLECVCVQHEIDHLDGIVMYERVLNPYILNKEISTNGKKD